MNYWKNDFDTVAEMIDEVMAAFAGSAHEHRAHSNESDSITMTKEGFITGVIRLQRLRNFVHGHAETRREMARERAAERGESDE